MDAELEHEIHVLQQLQHTNIISLIGSGQLPEGTRPFLVLEYCTGGTLARRLQDWRTAVAAAAACADPLSCSSETPTAQSLSSKRLMLANLLSAFTGSSGAAVSCLTKQKPQRQNQWSYSARISLPDGGKHPALTMDLLRMASE